MDGLFSQGVKVIAEISANHRGAIENAKQLIAQAKQAGADFVKFQHYSPETITTRGSHEDLIIKGGTIWDGLSLWDLYSEAMTPWDWTEELVETCKEVKIGWLSTPFDESAVDFLEDFSPELYKVASFEIVDLPLIRYIAKTQKPIVISTGMASVNEIDDAVRAAMEAGASDITLLRTNSGYPAPLNEMDLCGLTFMREKWGLPVGLSDHTLGEVAAMVSVGLGATVFEKHITLRRADGGPDAAFSVEPEELASYVRNIRAAKESIGTLRFGPSRSEEASILHRPSLRAVQDIGEGEIISRENVRTVRPAGGLPPEFIELVLGKRSSRFISQGSPLTKSDLVW